MAAVLDLIGGIGLFLIGIVLFMEGLRTIAGDSLRRAISRVTGSTWRSMATGLAATTLIQSAHATIVIAMGLAGAGLLSTAQSVAILIGANIGTTGTAWLVALLGLRFGLGPFAVVLVAGGALARLVSSGRPGRWGQAVAGFGLLFVGIDLLAEGLQDGAGLERFLPDGGASGAAALVLAGVVMTIATQSSSVTVAATITAVFAGVVDVGQASWLIIGQNLGTTSTVVLVGIGATPPARRLAASHVAINGTTALVLVLGHEPLLWATDQVVRGLGGDDALVVAGFHTLFNLVGAVLFMPVLDRFAGVLDRWLPDKGPRTASRLDPLTASVPGVATESARRALAESAKETCGVLRARMQHGALRRGTEARLQGIERAVSHVRAFLARVHSVPSDGRTHQRHLDMIHAVDRLDQLARRCRDPHAGREPRIDATCDRLRRGLQAAQDWLSGPMDALPDEARGHLAAVRARAKPDRDALLEDAAQGRLLMHDALRIAETSRWTALVSEHLDRLLGWLTVDGAEPGPDDAPADFRPGTAPEGRHAS